MNRAAFVIALLAALGAPWAARAEPTPFDGTWTVTLKCPPHVDDEDAKGYTQVFSAQVVEGRLRGTHGQEGEPGYHLLQGPIAADGSAQLRLDGVVGNPDYALKHAGRGKPYTYRVRATFTPDKGSGERTNGRVCTFRFNR